MTIKQKTVLVKYCRAHTGYTADLNDVLSTDAVLTTVVETAVSYNPDVFLHVLNRRARNRCPPFS